MTQTVIDRQLAGKCIVINEKRKALNVQSPSSSEALQPKLKYQRFTYI